MVCHRSAATALTAAAVLTGLPLNAWAEEAENSTLAAPALRGRKLQVTCNFAPGPCGSNGQICCEGWECQPSGVCARQGSSPSPAPPASPQSHHIEWSYDSSYCMSAWNNFPSNGQSMQLYQCFPNSGGMQKFQFDTSSDSPQLLRLSEGGGQYCVVGADNGAGAFVQLSKCDKSIPAQNWLVQWVCPSWVSQAECGRSDPQTRAARGDSMLLVNFAFNLNHCLAVSENRGANGQKLVLSGCDHKFTQQYQTWKPKHYDF